MSFTHLLFLTLCVGYLYTSYFYNIFVPYLYHVLLAYIIHRGIKKEAFNFVISTNICTFIVLKIKYL